jgi:hypothetical protein
MLWGHGGVDILAFDHGAILGQATHVFDDEEGGADAASGGSFPFSEAVRYALEAGLRGGGNCAERMGEPRRKCCGGLPLRGGLQR